MRKLLAGIMLAGIIGSTIGCTRVQQGAAVGAAAGSVGGWVYGKNVGSVNRWGGAGIGALSGGLVGALVADAETMDRW